MSKTYTYKVSMQCIVFASVQVESANPKEAEAKARKCSYKEFDIQSYTLTPETLESALEIE